MFKGLVRTLLVISLIPLFSSLFSGCGPFWVDPYITVRESQLNWVHIHYYNMRHKPLATSTLLTCQMVVEVVCLEWGQMPTPMKKVTSFGQKMK